MVTPAARREAVLWIRDRFGASWRRACGLTSCAVSVARHRPRRDRQGELRERLRELAGKKPRYGYRRLTWLLRREGTLVNPKRVFRLYQLEGLAVRTKKRTRRARAELTLIEVWRREYKEERPHISLGMRPPAELVALWSPPAPDAPPTPGTSVNLPGLS